jgi:hypothetical protein
MADSDNDRAEANIIGPKYTSDRDALSGVERLLAIEEIRLTKARYCAAVDDHDWKALRSVFADDCVMDWPLPGHRVTKPDHFVDFLAGAMPASIQTRHHAHNLQVEFTSKAEAVVRWDHENWTWFTDGSNPSIQQWGQYREKYRDTGRGWQITYFSEQFLFNSPASAKRRSAGIGDGAID